MKLQLNLNNVYIPLLLFHSACQPVKTHHVKSACIPKRRSTSLPLAETKNKIRGKKVFPTTTTTTRNKQELRVDYVLYYVLKLTNLNYPPVCSLINFLNKVKQSFLKGKLGMQKISREF